MKQLMSAVFTAILFAGCTWQHGSVPSTGSPAIAAATPPQHEALAITNVRVFDGERVWPQATVVVEGGRITYLDDAPPSQLPSTVISGRGMTLLPGLIDAHAHAVGETVLRDALRFGVTTILDMFAPAATAAELRAISHRADLADFRSAGPVATAPGGHGTQFGFPTPTISSPDSADAFVDARIAEGSDYIKIIIAPGFPWMPMPTLDEPTVAALVRAAHRHEKLAVVHVDRAADAEAAVRVGADGLVHVWEDTGASDAVNRLAAERGAFVVPTLTVLEGTRLLPGSGRALVADERVRPFLSDSAVHNLTDLGWTAIHHDSVISRRRASASSMRLRFYDAVRGLHIAGVIVLAGSDAPNPGTWHGVSLHRELELLVQAGLSPVEALRAATSATADAFRLTDRGRIAPGRRADLLLVEGDPTKTITATFAIVAIWKQGQRVERSHAATVRGPGPEGNAVEAR